MNLSDGGSGASRSGEDVCREKTAAMCRMLAAQGQIGLFGHISTRIPGTDQVLLTPGSGVDKEELLPDDLVVLHVDGTILHEPGGDNPRQVPIEWRIHTQIHRDRPEVVCIAHLHAHHATVLGIAGKDIAPVFTQAAIFQGGVPVWDNPRLVMTDAQAASLSEALGGNIAVQMRGHGVCVVGKTLEETFFNCTFLEENARKQFEAELQGGARVLSPEEAEDCAKNVQNPHVQGIVWRYYEHMTEKYRRIRNAHLSA